jgi:hypothetical protein
MVCMYVSEAVVCICMYLCFLIIIYLFSYPTPPLEGCPCQEGLQFQFQ